jgi:hypothetical protein
MRWTSREAARHLLAVASARLKLQAQRSAKILESPDPWAKPILANCFFANSLVAAHE